MNYSDYIDAISDLTRPLPYTPGWKVYWQARIALAQELTTERLNGKEYPRIRYGNEGGLWTGVADKHPCHDCGVVKGQYHVPSCDVERCPCCEGQSLSCRCLNEEDEE